VITEDKSSNLMRRLDSRELIAMGFSGALLLSSGFAVIRVILRAQRKAFVSFTPPQGTDYVGEVAALITLKLYPAIGLLLVAGVILVVGLTWKRVRFPAAAIVMLLAIPPMFMAYSANNLLERLLREPYQPQLRSAESFPMSSEWERLSAWPRAEEFPRVRVIWAVPGSIDQACFHLNNAMDQWADTTNESRSRDAAASSCEFTGRKGSDDVAVRGWVDDGQTKVTVEVTSTLPVDPESFL